jgi:hypothetical protein
MVACAYAVALASSPAAAGKQKLRVWTGKRVRTENPSERVMFFRAGVQGESIKRAFRATKKCVNC